MTDDSFALHGVQVRSNLANPAACPWLRYNYVCTTRNAYTDWLSEWASPAARLHPPPGRLPRGTSLWLGMSHLYQYAAALMCQHRDDLQALQVLRCESRPRTCVTKVHAYNQESQMCTGAALTEPSCRLVDVPIDTRCSPDAWPNVYGPNGTHAATPADLPELPIAAEDALCGKSRSVWPGCSMSVAKFSFHGGHDAIVIHNHPLQFVEHGLARLLGSLRVRMADVDTIVYASPWLLFQAYQRSMCTCRAAPYICLPQSEGGTFHRKHFAQGILTYARDANFSGNLVLTTRLLGLNNSDKGGALELMRLARSAGIATTFVDPSEVVRTRVGGRLCSSENVRRPCEDGGGHQCTPGVPDLIAWEIQRGLRGRRRYQRATDRS